MSGAPAADPLEEASILNLIGGTEVEELGNKGNERAVKNKEKIIDTRIKRPHVNSGRRGGVPWGTRGYPSALGGTEVDQFGNKGNERAVKRKKRP